MCVGGGLLSHFPMYPGEDIKRRLSVQWQHSFSEYRLVKVMKPVCLAVLILLVNSVVGEVVQSFAKTCSQFFSNPQGVLTPPTIFTGRQYRQICQKQANQNVYEFATYYDSTNRIPVYSAYEYIGHQSCNRKNVWYFEPQVSFDFTYHLEYNIL